MTVAVEAQDHTPVMVDEVLAGLAPRSEGTYVDATFGRGGHCRALLERLGSDARVFALDRDPTAVAEGRRRFGQDPRLRLDQGRFGSLAEHAERWDVSGRVDGVLFDLGVSSPQLDAPERGFSFQQDGALDMRMDPTSGQSAADWLAEAPVSEIADVLRRYGEERAAMRIARAIERARARGRAPRTTRELAELIAGCVPGRERHKHPATRSFQAIRIYINRELEELEQGLAAAVDILAEGGRLAVISFHSLEDRRVKRFIRDQASTGEVVKGLPLPVGERRATLKPIGRLQRPSDAEARANPRARSARLRLAERLA